ncbi:ABC transporter ATP-binding protein [Leeia sp. TBRC 13508]|uniref:ABC transporter ATP-binding protein n=1 Tax=Leeia speluncae TaxID=2884804 RepID=A0ABS8D5B7_9NEIS|nr:ABC transporter ATP-binding protein [Leeia speluncae]MCB6183161.1 ABC transporter ATP-binding protein [Leeia speluncae]
MSNPAKESLHLSVNNLHLQYGDNPILKGVSFNLAPGEVVALLGASGSGKTTLLRAVAGLEHPSQGEIKLGSSTLFDGSRDFELAVEKRNLGLVFQSYALWPHRTVFDNVAYGLTLRKVNAAEIKDRVSQALKNLGLGHLAERYPHQLSGGQQQRVAIARALVYNPPVILLDEPLSNLDAKLREEARAWLRELIVTMGLSALVVTHDQTEAMAMSDRILLLKDGRIEQAGSPAELYSTPQSLYTADFMGSNNHLPASVKTVEGRKAVVEIAGTQLQGVLKGEMSAGSQCTALIRLEKVVTGGNDNALTADHITSMFLGDRWEHLFHVKAGNDHLRLRAFGPEPLSAGQHQVSLPTDALWLFPQ